MEQGLYTAIAGERDKHGRRPDVQRCYRLLGISKNRLERAYGRDDLDIYVRHYVPLALLRKHRRQVQSQVGDGRDRHASGCADARHNPSRRYGARAAPTVKKRFDKNILLFAPKCAIMKPERRWRYGMLVFSFGTIGRCNY